MNSKFEIAKRELHAKLLCRRARTRWQAAGAGRRASPGFEPTHQAADQRHRHRRCGGRRRGLTGNTLTISTARSEAAARPAGPGRASSRRTERSSRRGRRAGGQATRRPEIRRARNTSGATGSARRTGSVQKTSGATSTAAHQPEPPHISRSRRNRRIYSPARRSTSCMMRPHAALTHATAATPRTRDRQGLTCRKSSKP